MSVQYMNGLNNVFVGSTRYSIAQLYQTDGLWCHTIQSLRHPSVCYREKNVYLPFTAFADTRGIS